MKINTKELSKLLEDRGSAAFESYQEAGKKSKGVSAGFIGSKDGSTYMLKSGEVQLDNSADTNKTKAADKRDLLSEYMTTPLYKRILKDRAPIIGLTTKHEVTEDIHIKSKFLEGFDSLRNYKEKEDIMKIRSLTSVSVEDPLKENEIAVGTKDGKVYWQKKDEEAKIVEFSNAKTHEEVIAKSKRLQNQLHEDAIVSRIIFHEFKEKLQEDPTLKENIDNLSSKHRLSLNGFEKVVAASLFMGEADYHDENIGIGINKDKEVYAVKIDHGRSGWNLAHVKTEAQIMKGFNDKVAHFNIDHISFKASDLKVAIDEILTVTKEETERFIQTQSYQLKKSGLKINYEYYGANLGNNIIRGDEATKEDELAIKMLSESQIQCKAKDKTEIVFEKLEDNTIICHQHGKADVEFKSLSFEELKSFVQLGDQTALTPANKDTRDALLEFASNIGYVKDEMNLRYSNLEKFYIERLEKQQNTFKEIKETLDIISKIDGNEQFKNGDWLSEIYGGNLKKDPVMLAIDKGLTIEGKDPIIWAAENSYGNSERNPASALLTHAINTMDDDLLNKFIDAGGNVNTPIRNNDTSTLLMYAASSNDEEMITRVVKHQADLNIQDNDGKTVLMHIVESKNNEELVTLFLSEKKIDLNKRDNDGKTALMHAIEGDKGNTIDLLMKKGCDLTLADNDGKTVLIHASEANNESLVKRLILDKKLDAGSHDDQNKTALMHAAEYGNKSLIGFLLTQESTNINKQDNNGKTALAYAAEYGYADVTKLLLEKGANPNIKDNENKKASEYEDLSPEIKKMLTKAEANLSKSTFRLPKNGVSQIYKIISSMGEKIFGHHQITENKSQNIPNKTSQGSRRL